MLPDKYSKDFGVMTDHDILVVIATKQGAMQQSIDEFHDAQKFCNAALEERIRSLEIHGATISQENAKGLTAVCERVGKLEDFVVEHETQKQEIRKIALVLAGIISALAAVVGILKYYPFGK